MKNTRARDGGSNETTSASSKRRRTDLGASGNLTRRDEGKIPEIAGVVRQTLTQHTTNIGIVADGSTRWDWQIGREGIVSWTLEPSKSQWALSVPKLNGVSPVDVLLLLGTWPNQRSPCWGWDKLQIVILCWVRKEWTPTRSRGKVGNVPPGWTVAEISLRHKEAGGVTDRTCQVTWAYRNGYYIGFDPQPAVDTILSSVLDCTVVGKGPVPSPNDINSTREKGYSPGRIASMR